MRRYSKVSPKVWTGELGRAMRGDPDLQSAVFYLVSNPHVTMAGIYRVPIPYAMGDTGFSQDALERVFDRLVELRFIEWDKDREVIWVKDYARHEFASKDDPENVNASKTQKVAIRNALSELEPSPLVQSFAETYPDLIPHDYEPDTLPHTPSDTPCHTPTHGVRAQEQEQEQEQVQEQEQEKSTVAGAATGRSENGAEEPKKNNSDYPAEFERWWSSGEKKFGPKKPAAAAWKKAGSARPPTNTLITVYDFEYQCWQAHKSHPDDDKFFPKPKYAERWIRDRCWERDDIPPKNEWPDAREQGRRIPVRKSDAARKATEDYKRKMKEREAADAEAEG